MFHIIRMKYNSWTILEEDKNPKYCLRKPLCRCKCGKVKHVWQTALNTGKSKSCGCLFKKESIERLRKKATKHGMSRNAKNCGHPLYSVWVGMKRRCNSSNVVGYHNYGGRGISVCAEWEADFKLFYNWATENGYKKGLQIDRIDNDGNYEPSNCRFVTPSENLRNTRLNRYINGENMYDLSTRLFGTPNLINERLRSGWSIEDAVSKPKRKYTRNVII